MTLTTRGRGRMVSA
uniref:Uncharacterized protein n=1 Tax=Arundo donax TaxID=35708 RepID=A0A0A9F8N8_ARUDO